MMVSRISGRGRWKTSSSLASRSDPRGGEPIAVGQDQKTALERHRAARQVHDGLEDLGQGTVEDQLLVGLLDDGGHGGGGQGAGARQGGGRGTDEQGDVGQPGGG